MARIDIDVPDELAARAQAARLDVSQLAQEAIRTALRETATDYWLDTVGRLRPTKVVHAEVVEALRAVRDSFARD